VSLLPVLLFLQVAVAQGPLPEIVTRSRGVDFHALVTPETVYVGQQSTFQLGVFLDQETRQRLRRNPEFVPPESRALLSYDLPERGNGFTGTIDGRTMEVHVFRRALFPLSAGRYVIPAAHLNYALPQSASFFSREETFTLRSEAVTVTAIDVPLAGRPSDWLGAVGIWRASAHMDSARGRAGDPLVLTLRIEGQGNVTLLPRPALAISWANVVAADERVRLDSTPTAMRGSKEFDWLVTPTASGPQRVPAVRYAYFNPFARRYEVAMSVPLDVRVSPGDVVMPDPAATPAAAAEAPLALRPILGDDTPTPLGDSPVLRWWFALLPLPAIAGWVVRRPRRTRRTPTAAALLNAMMKAPAATVSAASVRRLFIEAIRSRTRLHEARLTQPGAWTRALRLEGVEGSTATEVEKFLTEADEASFGTGGQLTAARANELFRRVDREARAQQSQPPAVHLTAITFATMLVATGSLLARDLHRASEPFAVGVAAYAGGDYLRAERFFADAARAAPRSAASWANFGTAGWGAHDTASAVVGWQRALRLDPTSDDLRNHLMRVGAPQDVGRARVLALPSRFPSALALLLWSVGWIATARQSWRRRPAAILALLTIIFGGATVMAARAFENRLEGRGLAVIADPTALRTLPALGAEGGSVPLIGEIATVDQRTGVWAHVTLEGGRAGWLPAERVVRLGND
jgi:hypothetical protein